MASSDLFPYDRWNSQLPLLSEKYKHANPYPHIVLEGFLEKEAAVQAMNEFPKTHDSSWTQYKHFNENKIGKSKREEFPPLIGKVVDEFNSSRFLEFLSRLSGIPGLIADPLLEGGGMHQTERGGFLNIHADFRAHYHHPWRRRLNLILYLNDPWEEEWNGALELWDKEMKNCVEKVAPFLNRALVFNTDAYSFHGTPDRLACPEGTARKSLALYYYSPEEIRPKIKPTRYLARPGDKWKAPLIWLDNQALHLYSIFKSKFGLTDQFISRILGAFGPRKK